jgi:hypothetical protein
MKKHTNRRTRSITRVVKTKAPRQQPEAILELVEDDGEPVLYCAIDGMRIAKRYSGKGWINLVPGYTVRGTEPGSNSNIVEIEYNPTGARPQ